MFSSENKSTKGGLSDISNKIFIYKVLGCEHGGVALYLSFNTDEMCQYLPFKNSHG